MPETRSSAARSRIRTRQAAETSAAGTQTLHRAIAILRRVVEGGGEGRRVTDIADEVGLHVATTHRLIAALAREGLVQQIPESRRYRVGPEVLSLSAQARRSFSLDTLFDPVLKRLAERTEDTVFLMARSGYSGICLARREGAFPIRTMTLDIGSRRPLGVGGGSLALLAFSPDYEAEEAIAANADAYRQFGTTVEEIRALVDRTRRCGYALNDEQVIRRVTSVALPVTTATGRVVAAITVAAIIDRLQPPRRASVIAWIRNEIAAVSPVPD